MDVNHKEQTKRIAKNTVYLYIRMLLGMLVSLYTSRLVLQALGVENYGIYNVVGGFVSMFSLISSSLSSSIWRFMTFETGTGNLEALKKIVSTSLLIQISLGVIVLIASETFGLWFLNHEMVIPKPRLGAANWVFQASILSFFLGLLTAPYNAILVAHEKMNVFAGLGLLDIFLNLGTVLFIAYAPFEFDRLIVYSFILVGKGILMQIIYLHYCGKHFPESHVWPRFHKSTWKEMSGFAGWNAIGCTAAILRDQGVNVLLNIFFGPVVNAARGIAGSISGVVTSFSGNFMSAVSPQITKSYASNDLVYSFSLVERGSRFGYYIMFFFALPIFLETPFILHLWLGEYPAYTVIFARLVLISCLIDILSSTLITLQSATGNIRNYQLAVGTMLLMNFPFSYVCLKMGAAPWSVYIVNASVALCCLYLRLIFLKKMVDMDVHKYALDVCLRVVKVSLISAILPSIIFFTLEEGWPRIVLTAMTSIISVIPSVLYIGCDASERTFLFDKFIHAKNKLTVCFR